MEDWKKLTKINSVIMKNSDGWEYRCTAYADIIEVDYWERIDNKMEKHSSFSIPTFCAEQLFTELAELAKNAPQDD